MAEQQRRKKLGLIVNPVAGLGGRVGLKGSDGVEIQQQARALGAEPQAQARTALALETLLPLREQIDLIAAPGEMGAGIARRLGFAIKVVGAPTSDPTSAEDTRRAALQMQALGVDLLLFAGGDGTARDLCAAVGEILPVLGIPAGVKIHSGAFATTPRSAGLLASEFLQGSTTRLRQAEVVDLDEETYRAGRVITRLYGLLSVPYHRLVQNQKAPSPAGESAQTQAIAAEVIERISGRGPIILGPGSLPRAVANRLGLEKTLVGVDVIEVQNGASRLVLSDANEQQLETLFKGIPPRIVITPIGGQGFLFGRGNQQIGPGLLRRAGKTNLIVVSLLDKIHALRGRPLLVDTGDVDVDRLLAGYIQVITGYHERIVVRIES